jgi:squalene-associated FAD-dependent desaturase
VAVVGAGYAGMAAAVTLAAGDVPVTVFESGSVPGGRARRVRAGERELDNGQHVLSGAYAELLRLMRVVGVPADAVLRVPFELRYADGFALRSLWLPGRLGLLGGMLTARKLPWSERIGALRFLSRLRTSRFHPEAGLTVDALLARHGQNGLIGHYLWRPLCISALNTPPERAAANVFLAVVRDALAGGEGASDLLLPRVDLSRLFPEPAADFVRARGGELRLDSPVRDLGALRSGFAQVILAVGPHQIKALAPELAPAFEFQPIYTCYLQYPAGVKLPFPMLGLSEGLVQWAFDRGALLGAPGLIACVISAQGDHQQMERHELAAACHRELARALRGLPEPLDWRIIAEKRATIACAPGRPPAGIETGIPGVLRAGDYTDPEYPPTLEAAARSGVRAADCLRAARRAS